MKPKLELNLSSEPTAEDLTSSQTIAKPNVISRCLSCKFWTKKTQYDWQTAGICSELKGNDLITIDIKTGWDGGYVDEIETEPNFGCVCWVSNGL